MLALSCAFASGAVHTIRSKGCNTWRTVKTKRLPYIEWCGLHRVVERLYLQIRPYADSHIGETRSAPLCELMLINVLHMAFLKLGQSNSCACRGHRVRDIIVGVKV